MLVRYWQPWKADTLRHQINQIFDELHAATPTDRSTFVPAVELHDRGDELVLRAQLPGLEAKDLDIQVTKNAVLIAGEHRQEQKTEENGYFKSEFRYGKFRRVVPLPIAIQNDQVKADYKDGILSLTLPKTAEVRNAVVKLNLGEAAAAPEAEATSADNN